MKAYLLHLFTVCGGGERVSLEIAKALHDRGLEVIYVTNSVEGLKKCSELFELPGDYRAIEVRSSLESMLSATGRFIRYRRLLLLSKLYGKFKALGVDGVVIDTSTNAPLGVHVSYIHYPAVLSTRELNTPYWRAYNWLIKRKVKYLTGNPRLLLTNSTWTANLLKEVYGLDAFVLHPPVDVEYYAYDGRRKEKIIVTVSRITPEKNLHLLPRAAFKLPDYEWYLIGSMEMGKLAKVTSSRIYRKIKKELERLNARNFHIELNTPRRKLRELLLSASFYVHPLFPEHFGIAVAEAMSAGCIPIVYIDGGAWTDLVSPIHRGLGYSNSEEIPSIIMSIESNPDLVDKLREKVIKQVQEYRSSVFRRKFIEILERAGVI
ncbi:MAG: glycosyltransferase [Sulfolobales archaeon]|nr:glycosyltransferase [Sulfolobales archaeon]